ncbi:unnamed protein product, partial [Phaeothamnion confervicola]
AVDRGALSFRGHAVSTALHRLIPRVQNYGTCAQQASSYAQLQDALRRDHLVRFKLSLHGDIAAMTKGQKEAVTVDGWTSRAGDEYFSLTRHFINEQWELTSLALDCVKHVGTTHASDLVRVVEDMVERANVTAINLTTACEPSMVAASRETKF